ncbi:MAG TPA: phage holin family protein [Gemmatimonadaceae bacterium]|nr:phage holin family protein [Gemmatimonadaceae bacterium]
MNEPSVNTLVRRLADDMKRLVHDEVALAKVELRHAGAALAPQGVKLGMAVGLAFGGSLTLIAFLVIGLGELLSGNYWLSALIVGVICTAAGGLLVQSAAHRIARIQLVPRETTSAVRESATWAKQEVKDIPAKLTSNDGE